MKQVTVFLIKLVSVVGVWGILAVGCSPGAVVGGDVAPTTFDIRGIWYCPSFNVGGGQTAPVKLIITDDQIEFWAVEFQSDTTPLDGSLQVVFEGEVDVAQAEVNVRYATDTTHTYQGGWVPDDGADPSDWIWFLAIDADSFTFRLDESRNGYGDLNDGQGVFSKL